MELLLEEIEKKLFEDELETVLTVPYEKDYLLYQYQDLLLIRKLTEDPDGIVYRVKGPEAIIRKLEKSV